ncbi:MASE1 domain-containing protein [Streptomyces beihaiensis]|uniref:MASE1 domain-containing protein n=1 Tax=Streptomyces beihaiensis TaxID=2984495 RepID=A0ABT3TZA0_9ACTN|nr:MASE1 domain-containing protein [Streptomyces beihaiensis]MCX3061707.1 MASE1 domain-containing protein [Streptomyces beihaiensis]
MTRFTTLRRPAATGLTILAVAVVYAATGRLGLLEQVVVAGAHITPLWPPTGVALAGLLLLGVRIWPGIAVGAFLVMLSLGPLSPGALAIAAGNTAGPLCSYALLRRLGFRTELDRLRDGLALVFAGAFAGMLVSSGVGSMTLLVTGGLSASEFWAAWSAWWTGDAMGVLVVAPVLLSLRTVRPPRRTGHWGWAEPVALMAATAGVTSAVTNTPLPLLFLVFPLLIWAALRTRLVGAAPCVLLMSVLTVVAATHRRGPFAGRGIVENMITVQALNGAAALTVLLLAAVVAERENTYQKLEEACATLTELVAGLTPRRPPLHREEPDGRDRGW